MRDMERRLERLELDVGRISKELGVTQESLYKITVFYDLAYDQAMVLMALAGKSGVADCMMHDNRGRGEGVRVEVSHRKDLV